MKGYTNKIRNESVQEKVKSYEQHKIYIENQLSAFLMKELNDTFI
jgi:hypothetical protein